MRGAILLGTTTRAASVRVTSTRLQVEQAQQGAQGKLVIPVESTRTACAGAVAAYLMRRVAARAGSYAPGIQEHMFFQLATRPVGLSLDSVLAWFQERGGVFTDLGYYLLLRRGAAPTAEIQAWVQEGNGYRAAVLSVDGRTLYRGERRSEGDAVGLTVHDPTSGIADGTMQPGLVMVDPWPGISTFASPPSTLDLAHRQHKYAALLLFWTGHS